jgi:hypothetical protein
MVSVNNPGFRLVPVRAEDINARGSKGVIVLQYLYHWNAADGSAPSWQSGTDRNLAPVLARLDGGEISRVKIKILETALRLSLLQLCESA